MAGHTGIMIGSDFAARGGGMEDGASQRRGGDYWNIEPDRFAPHRQRKLIARLRPDCRGAHRIRVIGKRDRIMLGVHKQEIGAAKFSDSLRLLEKVGVELL